MENAEIRNQFREDEIALIKRYDKQRGEWITNVYPKIGGRLRLAHEENEALSIESEIVRYDEQIAVVSAVSTTAKGSFKGIGMASVQRDQRIAPAILELAETRAIARSLRFAGYGVEYCSAEEVSHLENGDAPKPVARKAQGRPSPAGGNGNGGNGSQRPAGNSGGRNTNSGGNGNGGNGNSGGNGRLSGKQYNYLMSLATKDLAMTRSELDNLCLEMFGTTAAYLSRKDASAVIENLLVR